MWILAVIILAVASQNWAPDNEFNRAPWDQYGCTFAPDGTARSHPCLDNRDNQSYFRRIDVWPEIQHMVTGHTRVDTVFDLCDGQYGCVIDGDYHTTYGDVGHEYKIKAHWYAKQVAK